MRAGTPFNTGRVLRLPNRVEAIGAAWLTQALAARFPSISVRTITLDTFIDGTAQKCRFLVDYQPGTPAGPASLWVKGGFDPKGARQGDAFANEVRFFLDIAPELGVLLPDAFHGEVDPGTNNGVVVLEDLVSRGATFGHATEPLSPDIAAKVLSLQARIHARYWMGDAGARFAWLKPGGAIAGAGVVDQYFGFWDASTALPRFSHLVREQRDRPRMQGALNALMRDLRARTTCVLHGDSQGGNLFFVAGEPGYLDWQHCMLGHWAFDYAGFLVTSLSVADRRVHERELLRHYLAELAKAGVAPPGFDEAWNDYARYAMWAFMWVMCPPEAHPEAVCDLNSERACSALADLGTLRLLGA